MKKFYGENNMYRSCFVTFCKNHKKTAVTVSFLIKLQAEATGGVLFQNLCSKFTALFRCPLFIDYNLHNLLFTVKLGDLPKAATGDLL